MANGFFVTENWMKENTPLCKNIDVKDIYPFINIAQDKYIKDLLGSKFFDSLKTRIVAGTTTPDEIVLCKLIRPCLAFYICVEALPFLGTKLRNKGILLSAGDNMTNADITGLKYLRQECLNQAEYYLKRVQEYLCDNESLFTDYQSPDNPIYPSNRAGTDCDIAFDITHPSYKDIDMAFYKKWIRE